MQRLPGKEMFAGERISLREKPDTARSLTYFSLLLFAEPWFWSPDVCLSPKLSQPFTAEVAAQKHLTNQITDAVGKQHRMHKWPDFIFLRQAETFYGWRKDCDLAWPEMFFFFFFNGEWTLLTFVSLLHTFFLAQF